MTQFSFQKAFDQAFKEITALRREIENIKSEHSVTRQSDQWLAQFLWVAIMKLDPRVLKEVIDHMHAAMDHMVKTNSHPEGSAEHNYYHARAVRMNDELKQQILFLSAAFDPTKPITPFTVIQGGKSDD